jgi:hypothetical protein
MSALKIKEFPGLQRIAPETIEKHEIGYLTKPNGNAMHSAWLTTILSRAQSRVT